jgi:outer membrane translocation and assembly module TamA
MGGYSLTKVKEAWTTWNIFLKNDNYFLKGEAYYKKIPDKFYGIGNNSLPGNIERYSYETVNIKTYFLKKLPKKIFAGITYQFQYVYHLKFDPNKELIRNLITGTKGGINSGLGICLIYDTRNNSVNPQSGNYIEFYNTINKKILGGDYDFATFSFVAKKYISVYKNNIIGFHYLLTTNEGNTPFFSMSFLGSEEILRGYPKNRYRDLSSTAFQIEYRSPTWKRMGFVCFTGLGEVSKSIHSFSLLKLKPSYGAGLRIAINQKERLNIRLDYAFGYKISSFYLSIGEAF